ncbi:MAG: sulfatase [Lentisphaeraceae bacterium]|nr:sulfatase [Lentisphaeraceae bacterium]
MKNNLLSILAIHFVLSSYILATEKPNILIFFVDDMGWSDTEVNGSLYYQSPAQLRLAKEGMVFNQAYAQPLCSPSRAALLSGMYPGARFNLTRAITGGSAENPRISDSAKPNKKMIWPGSRNHLPEDIYTIAEALKDQGFQTWHLGKWHLRAHKSTVNGPQDHGFDKWIGIGGSGPGSYFSPYRVPDLADGPKGEYLGERMSKEACKLLENRDKDKPFFMYYSCFNAHGPYEAKEDLIKFYEEKLKKMPADNKQTNPVMAAMLHAMDKEFEVLLNKLDDLKIADNTMVIFASDNGGVHWEMGKKKKQGHKYAIPVTSNYPLRGGKCSWFEGGIRVPMTIRWPGKVAPNQRVDTPVHLIDLYPTILSAIQAKPKADQVLDGLDLSPLFQNGTLPERPLFCHFPRNLTTEEKLPGASYIRLGDYKLIRMYGGEDDCSDKYILYNIKKDIGETLDISAQFPEKTAQLKKKLNSWLQETGTLMPKPNPAYRASRK